MEGRRKPRLSLIYRIAAIFILAFTVAVSLVYAMSRNSLLRDTIDERSEVAESALIGAVELIWTKDSQLTVFEDPVIAETLHQSFRDICDQTGLRYLYLYNVEEDGTIRYTVCAANDDEDDRRMNEVYGFGSTQKRELYDSEKIALTGDPGCQLQIVDNSFGYVCSWVTPLISRTNEVKGLVGADYDMSHILARSRRTLLIFAVTAFIAFLFTFSISVILIRLGATIPLRKLAKSMSEFTEKKKADPVVRKSLFEDEISDLNNSFNIMSSEIEKYIGDIEDLTRQRVQNQTQMEVARRIQSGVVPETMEVREPGLNAYGFTRPAKEVGGDFYDIIRLPGEKICLIEGDVSGKGISAALFMMMMMGAIKEKIRSGVDPADALNEVNDSVCNSNPESMFATVFAAVFDCETGILTYANAGHNRPLIIGETIRELEVDPGIALGLFENAGIVSDTVTLKSGEGIFIYTDGITESVDSSGEQFGIDRLIDIVAKEKPAVAGDVSEESGLPGPARLITESIVASVSEFAKGLEQFDDITCLAFYNLANADGSIALLPKQSEFAKVKKRLLHRFEDIEMAKRAILCCEEMFTNIVSYSGADSISFRLGSHEGVVEAEFIDNGTAFDPVNAEQTQKDFELLDSGGMGILLAKKNCREMLYKREDDRNVLKMIFDE